VAKPELGTKRLCANCGAKFYDLNKDPIHCPKCGTVYEVAPVVTRGRPEPAAAVVRPAPVEEVVTPEPQEVETVSEEDVEIDETLDDDEDTFIEEQEEEDADVTDIIGGDIENEEEG
jgi:uncharacterized protein (TIGR02300 family)